MNAITNTSSVGTAARLRRLAVASIILSAATTFVAPLASQAKTPPLPNKMSLQLKPYQARWLTFDGGSISVELAMDIAAHGGNPNDAPGDRGTRH